MRITPTAGAFALTRGTSIAPVFVDPGDYPGVARAAADLRSDLEALSGGRARALESLDSFEGEPVIVGCIGKSPVIDSLIRSGKLDTAGVAGLWESFGVQVLRQPLPGIPSALVIFGSDKRGTIYGVYEVCERAGISPWRWWADVPAERKPALFFGPEGIRRGPPSVKYRGIFLNDEYPDLTNWVMAKYGPAPRRDDPPVPEGVANYGREFYCRIFELILRLKGNYLWPAMWNNAFNEDDPENPRLADEYGIVMGNSHQEPMLRAQKEWDRRYGRELGYWNWARHARILEDFWRLGIRRNKDWESLVTIGLRGANDTEMSECSMKENIAQLERIVAAQRSILEEEIGRPAAEIPQLWCLYKEVLEYYRAGLRVPDDVILLWAEDNWGNLRRVPTAAERKRPGGAGIYYHFDYHGGPRSYQWLDTSPLPKVWDQLSLAKQYGADSVWIVNVGHFKGYEFPMEYFIRLAWDAGRLGPDSPAAFARAWAEREFGAERAPAIARLISAYPKFNARRKPELLSPSTYSLVDYREAERVVEEYEALAAEAEDIYASLPGAKRDAFYQLVLFPIKACANLNAMYLAAGRNALYAEQGRASAAAMARETRARFQADCDMMDYYNRDFAGGKWAHFMDQTHIGYTAWNDPPEDSLDAVSLVEPEIPPDSGLGVAVEGSRSAWPGGTGQARLPRMERFNHRSRWLEIFNRGRQPFVAALSAGAPWIMLGSTEVSLGDDARIEIGVDWDKAPAGLSEAWIDVAGAGESVRVMVEAFNPVEPLEPEAGAFVEAEGYVAMEAEHYARKRDEGDRRWSLIPDYGRGLSAMRAEAPADAPPASPGKDAPCLEYRMYLFEGGEAEFRLDIAPTLNFIDGRPLRYAISLDDEDARIVTAVPADYDACNGNADWEGTVMDSIRHCSSRHLVPGPGYHSLRIWMVDPGLVLERVLVDMGGARPSYLGPPESYRFPA
jgi:hypothetical protein